MPKPTVIKQVFNPFIHRIEPVTKFHPISVAKSKGICYACYLLGVENPAIMERGWGFVDDVERTITLCGFHEANQPVPILPPGMGNKQKQARRLDKMRIVNFHKTDKAGKIVAFFDIELGKVSLRGARLVNGNNGYFVSPPSQKYTTRDGKESYKNYWTLNEQSMVDDITTAAIEQYGGGKEANDTDWLSE